MYNILTINKKLPRGLLIKGERFYSNGTPIGEVEGGSTPTAVTVFGSFPGKKRFEYRDDINRVNDIITAGRGF